MPQSASPDAPRFAALDGLRGLAIALVLIFHFVGMRLLTPEGPAESIIGGVVGVGWMGVDLFFVLSGFLITGILCDARGSRGYFWTFYARRTLRIFPIYYTFLAGYVFLLPSLLPASPDVVRFAEAQPWYWLYLSNVRIAMHGWGSTPLYTAATWSLAIEEQFYFAWPLVVFVIPRRWLGSACLTLAALALVVRVGLIAAGWATAATVLMPARMDSLALGGFLAVAARQPGGLAAWVPAGRMGVTVSTGALLAACLSGLNAPGGLAYSGLFMRTIGFTAVAVLFSGVLIETLTHPRGFWARLGSTRWLQWLGTYSYGLYLLHNPVRLWLDHIALDPASLIRAGWSTLAAIGIYAVIGIAVSVLVSLLSWHLFEAPINRLKRFVPYARPTAIHADASAAAPSVVGA